MSRAPFDWPGDARSLSVPSTKIRASALLASGINPDAEKKPPPAPTVIYFPQNDIELHPTEEWLHSRPNLFQQYSHIGKPADVRLSHLEGLNVSIENDVELDRLIPACTDGFEYLPPTRAAEQAGTSKHQKKPSLTPSAEAFSGGKSPLLSNGSKAPDHDTYMKLMKELTCENEDALRLVGRRKARPGHSPPNLVHFRKFWGHLELFFAYWDTSLDHYYDINDVPAERPKSPKGLKRLSVALTPKDPVLAAHKPTTSKHYKGRRISTGSRMPENFRIDAVRTFVEPLTFIFGCQMVRPKRVPQMEIRNLLIPVTQTAQVWRTPQDKALVKRGLSEGPVLGIQCRAETHFLNDKNMAVLDSAREVAGLLLLAQERAREGKPKTVPGEGKWYTEKPRWGGGPGGEFGEAEGNTDVKPNQHHHLRHHILGRRHSTSSSSGDNRARSEEEIWKELKPGPGLWDPSHIYLAVGKDRRTQYDNVFMISALFHHICILKLQVHPIYVEYLLSGKIPASAPKDISWCLPHVQRSQWFDLLDPEGRAEALRGIWGVLSYNMRAGESISAPTGQRQKSEVHHHFPFRKKTHSEHEPESTARSASVAF